MIVMLMSSSLDVVDALHVLMVLFLVDHNHDVHKLFSSCCWCIYYVDYPFLGHDHDVHLLFVFRMHFLCWLSFSWLMVIVMLMSSSLGAIHGLPVLMFFFLVNGDHDAHEFFSWCCWCTSYVDGPFLGWSWSWWLRALLLVLLV